MVIFKSDAQRRAAFRNMSKPRQPKLRETGFDDEPIEEKEPEQAEQSE